MNGGEAEADAGEVVVDSGIVEVTAVGGDAVKMRGVLLAEANMIAEQTVKANGEDRDHATVDSRDPRTAQRRVLPGRHHFLNNRGGAQADDQGKGRGSPTTDE